MSRLLSTSSRIHRLLSTTTSVNEVASFKNFLDLQANYVNQIYCVSQSEIKSYFPQGFPRRLYDQGEVVDKVCWIFRDPSWKMIECLRQENNSKKFLLYGPDKCGKTVTMLQVVHHCLNAGWIVVHIPSVFWWVHPKSEVKPSKQPGMYDLPNETCMWLQYFRTMNGKELGKIKLCQDYSWTMKEHSSKDDELLKVIEQGIMKPNIASGVFHAVLNEVSQLKRKGSLYSAETKIHKVLLAVDDFNGCFSQKSLLMNGKEWIKANQISFVNHLLSYIGQKKFTGHVITALSKRLLRYQNVGSYDYKELLGPEGMDFSKDYEVLEVPEFTKSEMKRCLEYYATQKWFTKGLNETNINELWYLTNGNPGELDRLCRSL